MPNPTAAILIIGDEILSGRTRDANMHFLAGELSRLGIDLCEVRMVSDSRDHRGGAGTCRGLYASFHLGRDRPDA